MSSPSSLKPNPPLQVHHCPTGNQGNALNKKHLEMHLMSYLLHHALNASHNASSTSSWLEPFAVAHDLKWPLQSQLRIVLEAIHLELPMAIICISSRKTCTAQMPDTCCQGKIIRFLKGIIVLFQAASSAKLL